MTTKPSRQVFAGPNELAGRQIVVGICLLGTLTGAGGIATLLSSADRPPGSWWISSQLLYLVILIVVAVGAFTLSWRDMRIAALAPVPLGMVINFLNLASPLTREQSYASSWYMGIVAVSMTTLFLGRITGTLLILFDLFAGPTTWGPWPDSRSSAPMGTVPYLDLSGFAWMLIVAAVARQLSVFYDQRARADEATAMRDAAETALRVRERNMALIHDDVLSTLTVVSRGEGALTSYEQEQLGRAADALRRVVRGSDPGQTGDLSAEMVDPVAEFCSYLAAIAPETEIAVHGPGDLRVPRYVATALILAATEAVQNVQRHAYPDARHPRPALVRISTSTTAVTVRVVDDGIGFDVSRPSERLGVMFSIRRRMDSLPGGSAEIRSKPGHGTAVILTWAADHG